MLTFEETEGLPGQSESAIAEVDRWTYEVESPFRPPHEIAELAAESFGEEAYADEAFEPEEEGSTARPTLRRGSRGAAVSELQQALIRAGARLTADGIFGPATDAAVRAFQSTNGLTADGVVGRMTWARLDGQGVATTGAGTAMAPPVTSPSDVSPDVPTVPLGTLILDAPGRSFSYPFTREDLFWTAKVIVYEAGGGGRESEAVLWALFNHYAFFRHLKYPSFSRFIRAYSTTLQPVLNSWKAAARHYNKPSSRFVTTGGVYKKAPHIPKGQLQRHLDIQKAPWSKVRESARRMALQALRGELPNPGIGNANEFASTKIFYAQNHGGATPTEAQWRAYTEYYARLKKLRWIGDVPNLDQMKNAFFVTASIADVPAGAVRIQPPAGQGSEVGPSSETLDEYLEEEDEAFSEEFENGFEMPEVEAIDEALDEEADEGEGSEAFDGDLEPGITQEYGTTELENTEFELEGPAFETGGAGEYSAAYTPEAPAAELEAESPETELTGDYWLEDETDPTAEHEFVRLSDGSIASRQATGLAGEEEASEVEFLGETNRRSPAYVRWVQDSLNRVAGAGLVVDGATGPRTREAVSRFQGSRGLIADGVVGPVTERALIAAGAPAPPGASAVLAAAVPVVAPPAGGAAVGPVAATRFVVRNRLLGWNDPVVACRVEVVGQAAAGTSGNNSGTVSINLGGVLDGTHTLRFTPRDVFTGRVGPGLAATAPRPARIWRPLDAQVTIRGGRVTGTTNPQLSVSGGNVTARLQPVWIASPNRAPRGATATISLAVVHHTGGPAIGPAINHFLGRGNPSAHYVIDVDGQAVKMVHESELSPHAGHSHWAGRNSVNARSVGIEIVHAGTAAYPAAQMTTLTQLLQDILAAHPTIPAREIVGHSDIGTSRPPHTAARPRRLGRKSTDPGISFDWAALRAAGLGIPIRFGPPAPSPLNAFFGAHPGEQLQQGDRDAGKVYGGVARPALAGGVIADLQTKLARIGYFCPATNRYDSPTRFAVEMFQEHFMGASQPRPANAGQVDNRTVNILELVA